VHDGSVLIGKDEQHSDIRIVMSALTAAGNEVGVNPAVTSSGLP
jgi:hypothetical protein